MYENILDALKRRAHDEALDAARQAVADDPSSARAHQLLSMAQRALGQQEEAMASIERAIALAPDDSDLHFQRGGLLMQARDSGGAVEALKQSAGLNPNQMGAYFLQAQVALGAGDVAEAERLARLMERLNPDHSWVASLRGSISLRKGDADQAVAILSAANASDPEDPQVMQALGFAYLQKQHFAFAEQLFRRLLALHPNNDGLRLLVADLLARQKRYGEALQELQPLLAGGQQVSPAVERFAGRVYLLLGRPQDALPLLRRALRAMPRDRLALDTAMDAWRRLGLVEDARKTLDALLDEAGDADHLWRARLSLEPDWRGGTPGLVDRWREAAPRSVPMLEVRAEMLAAHDRLDDAEAVAGEILALQPDHFGAEGRVVDALMRREPAAAVARVEALLAGPQGQARRRQYRNWLALAHDAAGNRAQALEAWTGLHQEVAHTLLQPWQPSAPGQLREASAAAEAEPVRSVFFVGAPGSGAELAALILSGCLPRFLGDRYGIKRPEDPFQNVNTIPRLIDGTLDPADVAQDWRAWLPMRGVRDGAVVDWLLWWDNILLDVVKPHIPGNRVVMALRDPRDMLLDWLAFGASTPLRLGSPQAAAAWLAAVLEHVRRLHDENLHDHRLVRLDEVINDPVAMSVALGEAMGNPLPTPPKELFRSRRFPAGHWRAYSAVLEDEFALLSPVAQGLGYPAD